MCIAAVKTCANHIPYYPLSKNCTVLSTSLLQQSEKKVQSREQLVLSSSVPNEFIQTLLQAAADLNICRLGDPFSA